MRYSLSYEEPYTIYEAPNERPRRAPTTDVHGERDVEPGASAATKLWVVQATGILLKDQYMVAEKLVLNPKIDATTLLDPTTGGAKVTLIAAK